MPLRIAGVTVNAEPILHAKPIHVVLPSAGVDCWVHRERTDTGWTMWVDGRRSEAVKLDTAPVASEVARFALEASILTG